MKTKVKFQIIGVHERDDMIEDMLKVLGKDKSIVYYDENRNKNCLARILCVLNKYAYSNEYTHICLLQDDLELCEGFVDIVEMMCETHTNAIINPYNSRLSWKDKVEDSPYVRINGCGVYGQCIIMPVKYIQDFLMWVRECCPLDYPHDDVAVGEYAKRRGIPVLATIPCILQHIAPTSSVLKYNNPNKISKVYLGRLEPMFENWMSKKYSISHHIPNSKSMAEKIKQ